VPSTLAAMDTRDPTPVDLRDYVAFDLEGAAGRRVFATDVVAVDVVCLEPGQVVDARAFASADAIYTVLGGIAWVVTDDAEVTLTALQSVMVPAAVPHGIRNDSPDPLIVQAVISPPDEAPRAVPGPAVTPDPTLGSPPPGLLERLRRRRRPSG
jgi:quercetin dioxygenase-like cupin family protein